MLRYLKEELTRSSGFQFGAVVGQFHCTVKDRRRSTSITTGNARCCTSTEALAL